MSEDPRYLLRVRGWLTALSILFIACGEDHSVPGEAERAAAEAAFDERMRERAGIPEPPSSAWPSEVEDLSTSLEGFESFEACLARLRSETPTAVAESLADLSYDGFYEDICRGLEAAHARDASLCDRIDVHTIQSGCQRRVAMLTANAEVCPRDPTVDAREPVCVAFAERNPALCRVAQGEAEIRCRAVLAGDQGACAPLRPTDRARCEAEVDRYAETLGEERVNLELRDAVFTSVVTETDRPAVTITSDALADGVRLEADGCRYRVALERPGSSVARSLLDDRVEPSFELRLFSAPAPGTVPLGPSTAVMRVTLPELGTVSTATHRSEGSIEITAFDTFRGGAFSGTIEATIHTAATAVRVEGRFDSFVRDLDSLPSSCAPSGADP